MIQEASGGERGTLEMSIVIGTLNRRDLLVKSLKSLARQTCNPASVEIIVVDNGSTDGTRDAVSALTAEMPNLRYVLEPRKGLSSARNRGIAEARAPLVAFFDDDAEAEPRWVEILLDMFRTSPGLGAAGGRIKVRWPDANNTRPVWMPDSLLGYYGHCDYGPAPRKLEFPDYPYGSNMVIRRDLLQKIGGFDPNLGPTGGNLMAAGEQDMFRRLYQLAPTVLYDPAAVVHHWAPPERVTRQWTLRRAFKHGVSNSVMQRASADLPRTAWAARVGRGVWRAAVSALSSAVGIVTRDKPSVVMSRSAITAYWVGYTRGAAAILVGSGGSPVPSKAALASTSQEGTTR
jgi:GT2 family glycosyltransferase